jgi:hypothetical protein
VLDLVTLNDEKRILGLAFDLVPWRREFPFI